MNGPASNGQASQSALTPSPRATLIHPIPARKQRSVVDTKELRDALADVEMRFLLHLPPEDLDGSNGRLMFHVEQVRRERSALIAPQTASALRSPENSECRDIVPSFTRMTRS